MSALPIRTNSWGFGPQIALTFRVSGGLITSITLSPSKTFTCFIEGKGIDREIFSFINAYLEGKKGPPLPLDWSLFTPFRRKGLETIQNVPIGSVASYGEIASRMGCVKGARAVGNVCNKNPYPFVIPCHRIIHSSGKIGGFAYDLKLKQTLLDFESHI